MTIADRVQIPAPHRQKGAVLLVGLIMVLLMTIVGMAAIRGTGLQETMAGNMRERNIAFQASEAGLSAGEDYAEQQSLDSLSFNGTGGLFQDLSVNGTPVSDWSENDWDAAREVTFDLPDLDAEPRYLIEKLDVSEGDIRRMLGSGVSVGATQTIAPRFYRVSSRGVGRSGQADAVVQSVYIKMQ